MAIAIAAPHSGAGKTTLTLAMLAALRRWGVTVQSFKVGPDYIDPMFHTAIAGRECRNLDPVLTSPRYVRDAVARHSVGVEAVVVEGAMGLFDGAGSQEDGSTAQVAKLLGLPVVLAVDASRVGRSLAATLYGFQHFDRDLRLAGVILNRVGSDRHVQILTDAIAPLGIPILGRVPRTEDITLHSRHLGLVPVDEVAQFAVLRDRLADLGVQYLDWQKLRPLLAPLVDLAPPLPVPAIAPHLPSARIAVARDRAFSFYYADNLDLLRHLGAELLPWSPLQDEPLPPAATGAYLGGGFPEVFAAELAANQRAIASVRASQVPIYAECGGLMYLSRAIVDFSGNSFPMAGKLPTQTVMGDRLTLGYRRCTPAMPHPWLGNDILWGHEFHRSRVTVPPALPLFHLARIEGTSAGCEGWGSDRLLASYVHLHWGGYPQVARAFVRACAK